MKRKIEITTWLLYLISILSFLFLSGLFIYEYIYNTNPHPPKELLEPKEQRFVYERLANNDYKKTFTRNLPKMF